LVFSRFHEGTRGKSGTTGAALKLPIPPLWK
jgi:hypothetical protein